MKGAQGIGDGANLWVDPCARAKREHWMRKPRVHAYVCACVRDTALFFLAFRPNPKRCADSPFTQPYGATNQRAVAAGRQQFQWAGVCDEHTQRQTYTHHICFNIEDVQLSKNRLKLWAKVDVTKDMDMCTKMKQLGVKMQK